MIYSVRLTIAHHYDQPAANSRHLIRVVPATIPNRQRLTTHFLDVEPKPGEMAGRFDFFGNRTMLCTVLDPHRAMKISLSSHVEMFDPAPWADQSLPVDGLKQALATSRDLGPSSPLHYVGPTPRLSRDGPIAAFAQDIYDATATTAANVIALGKALHAAMTFDATATTVDTDAAEAFRLKRGVCQDLSHIMILGLHALGIPAGYVSGYLRTLPPEGGVKLEGVDAMHAWVTAWCGETQGWVEYDPTNATLVGADHVVVGYGRDYSDVAPISGRLRSSGGQTNSQAVDVAIVT